MAKVMFGIVGAAGLALAVASGSALLAGPARADDNGLASVHDLRREKGRLCQVGHYHSGGGSGRTRKAAEADAIGSWQSFTAFEYGTDWARFSKAANRSISCSPSSSGYDCNVEARPCK
ncbi:MAG: hypothetical protein ABL894_11735 [Hyphomicrobium sp.]